MKKLLLVGWDAADWKVINPLMEEGLMPNVKALIERGVMGNLATLYPMLSPMLWTSIATGKRPFNHGVHGFSEPDSATGGVRPITNLSRSTRAIWNIATLLGLKSNVIGWWPSHPAEPIDGVMISDFYHKAVAAHGEPWPMRPGTIHPARVQANLAELRVHPQDLDPGLVMLFLPKLAEMDQEKERRVTQLAKTIAECTTMTNAAEALMRFEPWTLTCVYLDAIDHFCHGFMNHNPPKVEWISQEEYDLFHEVVRSAYIYHDILLGRLLRQTDDDTFVMLVSDHGFHSDHLRPRNLPDEPAGPAEQHRHYGIFVVAGPGIKQDELVCGATLLDICPTVLACLGLPVGEDMDGRVLTDVFEETPEIEYLPSWDGVEGADGSHPKDLVLDPMDAQESLRQLVELGYIEAPPEDRQEAVDQCMRELRYNLARSYMDASWQIEAVPILEELHERWPAEFRFGILLINCYLALDRPDEADALIDVVVEHKKEDVIKAREELTEFQETNKEKLEKLREGDLDALTEEERQKLHKLRARVGWNPMALSYLRGVIATAQGNYDTALEHLNRAEATGKDDLRVLLKLGDVFLKMKRHADAKRILERAVELDPENALAWLGLARTLLDKRLSGSTAEALEAATHSVGLLYHNPMAHFVLGMARHRAGMVIEALKSLETAVEQNPNFPEAYRRMAYIYEKRLFVSEKAKQLRKEAVEAESRIRALRAEKAHPKTVPVPVESPPIPPNAAPRFPYDANNTVVVVSGLPRSGTSMMMQMLAAGGLEALTDHKREADLDNPRGYFEFEKAKAIAHDNAWLDEAPGKAVKIVANMLPSLKQGLQYKIVFMWREMEEILQSQATMLKRSGHKGEREFRALSDTFTKQLRRMTGWLASTEIVDVLYIDYADAVADPPATAASVNAFLGGRLDESAMVAAVSPDLYRQRKQ